MATRTITPDELDALLGNRSYWAKRSVILEDSLHKDAMAYSANLQKQYEKAFKQMDKEAAAWYARFAKSEGVSMAEAKRMLSSDEMHDWKMEVEEYIAKGKTLNYSDEYARVLESASARAHISRLEALQLQCRQQIEAAHAYERSTFGKTMEKIFKGGYYRQAYEVQKGMGAGWDISAIDTDRMKKVLSQPWTADAKTFSDRLWDNKQKLLKNVNDVLSQGMIRGQGYGDMAKELSKRMDAKLSDCERLVTTESAYFASQGMKDTLTELGCEEYEIVATLDGRTCKTCGSLDGKVVRVSDHEPGVTAPPFHARCRCTTCPYFNDEFTVGEMRAARGEDGKTYYVPSTTTYEQWSQAFAGGGSKSGFSIFSAPEITNVVMAKAHDSLDKILSEKNDPLSNKLRLYNETTSFVEDKELKSAFAYDAGVDCIKYNPDHESFDKYDWNYAIIHELSHRMDILEIRSMDNEKFIKAIEVTSKKIYNNFTEITKKLNGKYDMDIPFHDIIDAVTEGKLNIEFGHGSEYYEEDSRRIAAEIFSELSYSHIDSRSLIGEEILKELVSAFKGLIGR